MTKPRKPRSDSTTAKVDAFQRAAIVRELPIELTGHALTVWRAAIKCRDDWQPWELMTLARMCNDSADVLRWHADADALGDDIIVNGKVHPIFSLIDMTERRILATARHLQLHARARRGEARDVARGYMADLGDLADFIAPDGEFKH